MNKYYKTELHTHSKPVSFCSEVDVKQLVKLYKEKGYNSVVLTNHFTTQLKGDTVGEKINWYLEDYYNCYEEGKCLGLNVILGAEKRFTENINDYLIYGITPEDLTDIYELLYHGIDNFYKVYKNDRNVIIQAHPFRDHMEKVDVKSLDGIEVFNMHPHHNSRIGFAAQYAKVNNMIATCGSDFHHVGHEGMCGILTENALMNSFDIADILKSKNYCMYISDFLIGPMKVDI